MQTYVKIGSGGEAILQFIHDMCHEEPIGGQILALPSLMSCWLRLGPAVIKRGRVMTWVIYVASLEMVSEAEP
jgi:hypothetical protein